ncbi:MAG: Holliday junction resolvase RuvX [Candidatus Melainabacteria bacterium]|nr:Holliday junction resolvase RuvX [Candidatus Melainabacteria bacterium]
MGCILSIDYGLKRIGLAISDENKSFAFPYGVIENKEINYVISHINKIIIEKDVELIIIGMAYNMDKSKGKMANNIEAFIKKLKTQINISIQTIDERLSSFIAEENLREAGLSSKEIKSKIDVEASRLLLEEYLKQNSLEKKEKIRLYLGYAPGKTTALNGIILRALGANLKVKIILFSKCPENTSESKIYEILKLQFPYHFDFFFAGTSRIRDDGSFRFFGDPDGWTLNDQLKLDQGIKQFSIDIASGKYDVLCIDEITDLLYHKEQRISEKIATPIFKSLNPKTSLIVTGHLCPDWLVDMASTVVKGKAYKHYKGYTKGIEW